MKRTLKDMEYEAEKNTFIKEAERHANDVHGVRAKGSVDAWYRDWNMAFFGEMKRLAREAGLNAF